MESILYFILMELAAVALGLLIGRRRRGDVITSICLFVIVLYGVVTTSTLEMGIPFDAAWIPPTTLVVVAGVTEFIVRRSGAYYVKEDEYSERGE